jgi:hypothetical protein
VKPVPNKVKLPKVGSNAKVPVPVGAAPNKLGKFLEVLYTCREHYHNLEHR